MSQFVVSARKYRPTRFDEVVGQNHVAKTLKNALQTNKLAHAFLFCGPRGVGKTTCARILAKVINCENPTNGVDPCNVCSSCKSFNENASFNILELDAASNNSVEHIRTLIEQVRFQPQQGTHKVFIIDEVHMLSSQAFNAFLKTLEEPPPYAIFILATTEKHKILPTILSRCQIFDFKRIQPADIVEQLTRICTEEGIKAEKEALFQIAEKADGAMRDALSIFDKIAGATAQNITYKDVATHLNILDYDYYFKMTDAAIKSDRSRAFLLFDEVVKNGFEADLFVQGLASHFRQLLVCQEKQTLSLLECSDELKQRYFDQALLTNASFLLTSLNLLNQCDLVLPRVTNKRLHVEVVLSKICHLSDIVEAEVFIPAASTTKARSFQSTSKILEKSVDEKEVVRVSAKVSTEQTSKPQIPPTQPQVEVVIPKGNFSTIDQLRKKILEEEISKKDSQKDFTIENIKKIWDEYRDNHLSKSTKSALGLILLELEKSTIRLTVPNPMTKALILQETQLVDNLRDKFGIDSLHLEIEVDKSKFPEIEEVVMKKSLSESEKLQQAISMNSNVKTLVNLLGLKLGNDH